MFNTAFLKNCGVNETIWRNMVQPDRTQITIRRMHFAFWITKVTHTHTHTHIFFGNMI
jgi:hypothetical protein